MAQARLVEILEQLITAWCGRREVRPLGALLPSYLAYSGLTDSTADLYDAVNNLRGLPPELLPESERVATSEARAILYQSLKASGVKLD
jgi:hypothetical protein